MTGFVEDLARDRIELAARYETAIETKDRLIADLEAQVLELHRQIGDLTAILFNVPVDVIKAAKAKVKGSPDGTG